MDREELNRAVRSRIVCADVALDVGTGIHPQTLLRGRVHICIEPHHTYAAQLVRMTHENPSLVILQATWDEAMRLLPDDSVDSVFGLDFIEHLTKEDGIRFLAEATRVASRQVVVFTPLGFYPQGGGGESGADRWGLDGGAWQTHKSGWTLEDFDNTWDLFCCHDYHQVDEFEQPLAEPFGALWAIRQFEQPLLPRRVRAASASHRLVDRFWARAGDCVSAVRRATSPRRNRG